MSQLTDAFDAVFGPGRGLGAADEDAKAYCVQLRFTVRWDAESECWMAAATQLQPESHAPLMNASSKRSPQDAAAQLWEQMVKQVRDIPNAQPRG